MEALMQCYGDGSSDSDSESSPSNPTLAYAERREPLPHWATNIREPLHKACVQPLPPPPIALLHPPNFLGPQDIQIRQTTKVRSFPHVDGNYALHVYIPSAVTLDSDCNCSVSVNISSSSKKEVAAFLKKISSLHPSLCAVDVDVPLNVLCKNDEKLEQVLLGREFHISLGRTVPIRVHQIDSVVSMLKQKLQTQPFYWINFDKWEVFVNDDRTRTFLSVEVVHGGLVELQLVWVKFIKLV
ncbi:U6 snRNA phosphodiesterase [Medicago truncatula]|uniref:U6 snRNA phosphodiesterase n=1 Tax=Medicago truncatula TaxID=3880 RepID=UPI001967A008|nr:U6 snRNA phosphodiesterase [Medicago truncatula]